MYARARSKACLSTRVRARKWLEYRFSSVRGRKWLEECFSSLRARKCLEKCAASLRAREWLKPSKGLRLSIKQTCKARAGKVP